MKHFQENIWKPVQISFCSDGQAFANGLVVVISSQPDQFHNLPALAQVLLGLLGFLKPPPPQNGPAIVARSGRNVSQTGFKAANNLGSPVAECLQNITS